MGVDRLFFPIKNVDYRPTPAAGWPKGEAKNTTGSIFVNSTPLRTPKYGDEHQSSSQFTESTTPFVSSYNEAILAAPTIFFNSSMVPDSTVSTARPLFPITPGHIENHSTSDETKSMKRVVPEDDIPELDPHMKNQHFPTQLKYENFDYQRKEVLWNKTRGVW